MFSLDTLPRENLAEVARALQLNVAVTDQAEFVRRVRAELTKWVLPPKLRRRLKRALFGTPSNAGLAACNIATREIAVEALVDILLNPAITDPDVDYVWLTFTWDGGWTWEWQPEIDVPALFQHVRRAVDSVGLDGIGVLHIDTFRNIAREPGARLCAHVHVLARAKAEVALPSCRAIKKALKLRFPNWIGAPGVVVKRVRKGPSNFANLGRYMLNVPHHAKNPIPRKDKPGRFWIRSTEKRFTPSAAVRLAEIMSHMSIFDAVIGMGPWGVAVRAAWKAEVTRRAGISGRFVIDDLRGTWRKARRSNGNDAFEPCMVDVRPIGRRR